MSNNETFSCVSSGHLVEDRRTVETQGLIWPQYACLSAHFFVTFKKNAGFLLLKICMCNGQSDVTTVMRGRKQA